MPSNNDVPPRSDNEPSAYEKRAWSEIHARKTETVGRFRKGVQFINWPLDKAGEAFLKMPGVGAAIEKSVGELLKVINTAAQGSVRPQAIFEEYREKGFNDVQAT